MARRSDGLGHWIRHTATGRLVAATLGAFYIRLVTWTTRWRTIGQEHRTAALGSPAGTIAVFWHGRLFMSPVWAPARQRRCVAMISNNRDGDLIAALVARFRARAVRGSTYDRAKGQDKGGAEAFAAALVELAENRAVLGITPDGPRGPRMRAQKGAVMLALESGAPILPVSFSTCRGKELRNWDRFLVPWPFTRGVMIYGPPITPAPGAGDDEIAAAVAEMEATLVSITQEADRLCGRKPTEPAPAELP